MFSKATQLKMPYSFVLTTPTGLNYYFHIRECALLFQRVHGGKVAALTD